MAKPIKPTARQTAATKKAATAITTAENKQTLFAPYQHLVGKTFNNGVYGPGTVLKLEVGHTYNSLTAHCHLDVEMVVSYPGRQYHEWYNAARHHCYVQAD